MTEFTLPATDPARVENLYAAYAEFAGVPVPGPGERIRSIAFKQDGIDWVATIGDHIRGVGTVRRRRNGQMIDVHETYGDTATVQAIFPSERIMIVTDGRPISDQRSYWVNPIPVEQTELRGQIELFDPPADS
jgi:hypothetical protein